MFSLDYTRRVRAYQRERARTNLGGAETLGLSDRAARRASTLISFARRRRDEDSKAAITRKEKLVSGGGSRKIVLHTSIESGMRRGDNTQEMPIYVGRAILSLGGLKNTIRR